MKHFLPCGKTGPSRQASGRAWKFSQTASMDAFCTLREAKRFRKSPWHYLVRASIPVSAVIEDGEADRKTRIENCRIRDQTEVIDGVFVWFPVDTVCDDSCRRCLRNRFRLSSARQTAAEVSDGLSGGPHRRNRLFWTADAGTDQLCCIENGSAADGEDSLSLNLLIKTETLFHALNLRIRGDFGENGDGNVFFLQPSSRDVSVPRRTKPGVVTRRIREIRRFRNNAGSSRTASGAARSVCFLCSVR